MPLKYYGESPKGSARIRMKRFLFCLLPWMVAAAAMSQTLRPAQVTFTYHKPIEGWRDGDKSWISPNALIGWGMAYSFIGNDATIQAEGRTLRVTGQTVAGKFVLPLNEISDQLGAEMHWDGPKDKVSILGQARFVTVRQGKISFDTTLAAEPTVTTMQSPRRIIVDLKGVRLGNGCKQDLDASARVAQYTPDTVRIMVVTAEEFEAPILNPTRAFEIQYSTSIAPPTNLTTPPEIIPKPISTAPGKTWTQAGPFVLAKETDRSIQLALNLTTPLGAAPGFRRIDPLTIELFLPTAHYIAPPQPLGSPSITAFEAAEDESGTRITIRMTRPLGVEFSTTSKAILISMTKPLVGNGKLTGKTVVVDAGHGDHDPGAKSLSKTVLEKNLTLAIAKLTAQELTEQGATVIMTRKTDTFIALKERAEIANRNNADFFISIHINSNKTNKTSGSISFYHGTSQVGQVLALCIQEELKKIPSVPGIGVWSDFRIYKNDGFAVLRHSKMPAVLLELGFINHPRDVVALQTAAYQKAAAEAIVRGLKVYLGDAQP